MWGEMGWADQEVEQEVFLGVPLTEKWQTQYLISQVDEVR